MDNLKIKRPTSNQDSFDFPDWLPDWNDVKLVTSAGLESAFGSPAAALANTGALVQKKVIETNTGTKLTDQEIKQIQTNNIAAADKSASQSVQTHLIDPVVNILGNLKWYLIIILAVIIFLKFK